MKKQRFRIQFSKLIPMRFTGHLDLIQTWERVFRRGGLPLAYSEGFSPRPLLNLAAPLPLGFISTGEIGDFWTSEIIPKSEVDNKLTGALPPGITIQDIQEIQDLHGPKLPSLVIAASYSINLKKPTEVIANRINSIMESTSIIVDRKGKSINLRDLINQLEVIQEPGQLEDRLVMSLAALPGATGRPDEVLKILELNPARCLICRTKIHLQSGSE